MVARRWIESQLAYLSGPRLSAREEADSMINEWGGRLLLMGLGLGVLGWLSAEGLLGASIGAATPLLVAAMKTAPAVGAALLAYNNKIANAESVKQAAHMRDIYSRASIALDAIERSAADSAEREALALIEALGKEALAENASWLMLHRQRKVSWHGK